MSLELNNFEMTLLMTYFLKIYVAFILQILIISRTLYVEMPIAL